MSTLAPTLQAFFTDRLARQRQASPHTIAAYRDTVKLLLVFAEQRTGKSPSAMDITDLDAPLIGAFLNHLETDRGNSVRTRNARLAAIHSLFRYAALRHPQDAAVIQQVGHRRTVLSNPAGEENFAPRLASLRGHEVAQRRYRRLRDRAMDGPREHRNLPDLHPRRPGAQGTGTGPHRATRRPTRPLPTPGRRPGLPRRTVIMPNTRSQERSPPRADPTGRHNGVVRIRGLMANSP